MKFGNLVFILLAKSASVSESHTRFVNYTVVSSASTSHARVSCAEACADNLYLAARINNITGFCEGLTWDWGSDPQYVLGYSYIRKTKTVEIYNPAIKTDVPFQWLIPGLFGVGGRLEFYITLPTGTNWDRLAISLLDTSAASFHVYDNEPEVIMVHISIKRSLLAFKQWTPGRWKNILFISPLPLDDGSTHKITIVPLTDLMQILFDDEEVVTYTHPTDPATAKQIKFSPTAGTVFELHNITFVGV